MAKAAKTEAVTKTVVVEEAGYELTLTNREAAAIKVLLGAISGAPNGPLRTETTNVYEALHNAGVNSYEYQDLRDDLVVKPRAKNPDYSLSW